MAGRRLDIENPEPPSRQVAASLRDAIASGAIAVGEQLGSVRELANEYGVSNGTIQQAFRQLRDEGLITTWQGRGTFVRSHKPATSLGGVDGQAILRRLDELTERVDAVEAELAELKKPQMRKSTRGTSSRRT